jgi:predicted transposase YbfD/YdcC
MAKGNQPLLCKKISAVLSGRTLFEAQVRTATTVDDCRRGRVETRTITVADSATVDLACYTGFRGVRQVFVLHRSLVRRKTGQMWEQAVLGVTSLCAKRATPADLLGLIRGHWSVENKSHYVRDVTFGEDKSQVRVGNLPQVMAVFRNVAIALIRLSGFANVAKACRYFAARPERAIALVGILIDHRTE